MAYKLFDINNQEVTQRDLQNKGLWCKHGATKEEVFVDVYGKELDLIINPEKATNPYVPDLFNTKNNLLADLKTQNTPFFQAKSRFGYDPQYTVVFNSKDRLRYNKKYPEIEIYFGLDWQVVKFEGNTTIKVNPLIGVWHITFKKLDKICETAPLHNYQQRIYDTKGNAKGSYVIDLKHPSFTRLI